MNSFVALLYSQRLQRYLPSLPRLYVRDESLLRAARGHGVCKVKKLDVGTEYKLATVEISAGAKINTPS